MEAVTYRAAKAKMVELMLQGYPWHEAVAAAGLRISRSTAYQVLQRVRDSGRGSPDRRAAWPCHQTTCSTAPLAEVWVVSYDATISPHFVLGQLSANGGITPVGRLTNSQPRSMAVGAGHQLWMTTAWSANTLERVDLPVGADSPAA